MSVKVGSVAAPVPVPRTLVAGLAVVGAAVAGFQLTRPGMLTGMTPDVSVYLGGAVRLIHGAVPYRDFVFVQPPAFPLLATPFAWLSTWTGTRTALAALRLLGPLLAAAAVALTGTLLRHRGPRATVVACLVMAFFPAEIYALRGPMLEPVAGVLCLGGLALLFRDGEIAPARHRTIASGIAFGLATAVKLPAILPLAVCLIVCARRDRPLSARFAAGGMIGFGVPVLPFLLIAPAAVWRDAVLAQLSRVPLQGHTSLLPRIGDMSGAAAFGNEAVMVAVSLVLAAVVVVAWARERSRSPLYQVVFMSTLLVGLAQFGPAQYYPHYAAFMAPFLAPVVGFSTGPAARAVALLRRDSIALAAVLLFAVAETAAIAGSQVPDIAHVVDAMVPAGACTLSDAPVMLVTTDRFEGASPATCTTLTDPEGTTLALGTTSPEAVAAWTSAFTHTDYIVTWVPVAEWTLPPAAHLDRYVASHFRLEHDGSVLVYVRSAASP